MSALSRFGHALYQGKVSIDFVGRRRLWYTLSALIVLLAIGGLAFKGLNYGIEFTGGVEYRAVMTAGAADQQHVTQVRDAVVRTDIGTATSAPIVNTSGASSIRVQIEPVNNDQADRVSAAIQKVPGVSEVSRQSIGASWGSEVANRAFLGLLVFTVLVVLFIWAYFREWKMSVAAMVALAHDLVITIGVYALSGFEVSPATVTGVLTILGFSLYDTVVVFDKVRENTKDLGRSTRTYSEAANLAVNQTLVRSINTSVVALLPVAALLYVGVVSLGTGALKDLALALFVGMAAGAYSSIFIATPLLAQLKEREPEVRSSDARAIKRRKRQLAADPYAHVPASGGESSTRSTATRRFESGVGRRPEEPPAAALPPEETTEEQPSPPPAPAPAPERASQPRQSSRPVTRSASAKRPQPSRKTKSKRTRK
jgi:preprotein translocase subunit SecF